MLGWIWQAAAVTVLFLSKQARFLLFFIPGWAFFIDVQVHMDLGDAEGGGGMQPKGSVLSRSMQFSSGIACLVEGSLVPVCLHIFSMGSVFRTVRSSVLSCSRMQSREKRKLAYGRNQPSEQRRAHKEVGWARRRQHLRLPKITIGALLRKKTLWW